MYDEYKRKIINKLTINTGIISNVLLGGYIISANPPQNYYDYVKVGTLVSVSVITDGILIKKCLNKRKNMKKL